MRDQAIRACAAKSTRDSLPAGSQASFPRLASRSAPRRGSRSVMIFMREAIPANVS
jgi:hypothetical protein